MLTAKQEAFVVAYVETGNASEAYRRAYDTGRMRPATINRNAHALVRHSKVAARIAEVRHSATKRMELSVERVVEELACLAFSDLAPFVRGGGDEVTIDIAALMRSHASRAVREIGYDSRGRLRVKLHNKHAALHTLSKYFGILDKPAKFQPFDEWTPDMIRQVFGEDAQALIEAQEAEAQLPPAIEAR